MKKTSSALLLFFAVLPLSAQDGSLESDYTLERITGGGILSNTAVLGPFHNEWTTITDQLSFQVGKEDRRQFGFSFLGGGILLPGLIVGISDINCAFRPGDGHRIRFDINTNLAQGMFAEGGFHELDPWLNGYLSSLLHWDFLSRKGSIAVDPAYFDMAFFCGPQVKRGQFGFRSGVQVFGSNYSGDVSGGLYLLPVLGITDRFQVSGRVNILPPDAETDNTMYGIRADYRLPHVQISPGWLFRQKRIIHYHYDSLTFQTTSDYETHSVNELFLEGTCISGHHIESAGQVRGNWDGYFSDLPGPLQLLSKTRVSCSFTPGDTFYRYYRRQLMNDVLWWDEGVQTLIKGHPLWSASQGLRFGLLPMLTLGSDYGLLSNDGMLPQHRLFASATISNVKLRGKGPSEVSKFEYEYGYLLKEKEFKVSARYLLPFTKPDTRYIGTVSLSSDITAETVGNGYWPYSFFFAPPSSGLFTGSFEQSLRGYDFVLSASACASAANGKGRVIVSNSLGLSTFDLYDFMDGEYSTTFISDNISFLVPALDRSAFSFGFQAMGQTDKHVSGLNSFYCVIYFSYLLAL